MNETTKTTINYIERFSSMYDNLDMHRTEIADAIELLNPSVTPEGSRGEITFLQMCSTQIDKAQDALASAIQCLAK